MQTAEKMTKRVKITKTNPEGLAELLARLLVETVFSFDTETTEEHFIKARLRGISFGFENGDVYYLELELDDEFTREALAKLRPYFESKTSLKVGHNIKYDMHILANYGIIVTGQIFDTMIAFWLLNPDDRPFGLKDLTERYLHKSVIRYEDVDKEDLEKFSQYAMDDAINTFTLYQYVLPILEVEGYKKYYEKTEMPFLRAIFNMERRGIRIDVQKLSLLRVRYYNRLNELQQKLYSDLFGSNPPVIEVTVTTKGVQSREVQSFNLNSPVHLRELFQQRKYPVVGYTPKANVSTNHGAIKTLVEMGITELRSLLEYREVEKLLNSFIVPILEEHLINGRLYPSYLQHGTRTGRLACSNPNFQNIPVRNEYGREIRTCFVSDELDTFIDADFSQIELRLMAHFSHDPQLLEAYKRDEDIHKKTGELVLGIKNREMTKSERTLCKNLNFGLQYGAGPKKFSELAGITYDEAKDYITKYFRTYRKVKAFQISYPVVVRQQKGMAKTLFGRRRFLPKLVEADIKVQPQRGYTVLVPKQDTKEARAELGKAEREAVSTRVQGTAADVLRAAMISLDRLGYRIVGQVHDELLISVDKTKAEILSKKVQDIMQTSVSYVSVPLKVNVSLTSSWGEKEEDDGL